jgi:hypothetical protein
MSQDPLLLSAVMHLMNNDWFRRVWVVQEAALATNLRFLCGEHEINRIVLKDAVSNVQSIVTLYKTCGIPLDLGLDQAQTLFSTCSMVKDYWRERRSVCTLRIEYGASSACSTRQTSKTLTWTHTYPL